MNAIEKQPSLESTEKNSDIPANYLLEDGSVMPADIIRELNPVQPGTPSAEFQKELLEKVRLAELAREAKKEEGINSRYAALNEADREAFVNLREIVNNYVAMAIKKEFPVSDFSTEEQCVLIKLQLAYRSAKEENPDRGVNLSLSAEVDKKVYANMTNRLALDALGGPEPENNQPENKSITAEQSEIAGDKYANFRAKSGETAPGVFWNEFHNVAAKELKESGKLQWGKERIYFDVPMTDLDKLKTLSMKVAQEQKIPIAFKKLDAAKTAPINFDETRFVTNFASVEDAKRFYMALAQDPDYQKLQPDRQRDYSGFQLDPVAHYANGFRETRTALKAVAKAVKNPDNTYTYTSTNGKQITIPENNYQTFMEQLNKMPDPKNTWEQAQI